MKKRRISKRKLKQKLYGLLMIIIGWLSVPIESDATFAILTTIIGMSLILTKRIVITD